MSRQPRQLPDRPSLRYVKIEAKRRLAAGEFDTLHEAQLAIAREHGLPSWTAPKKHIEAAGPASHALTQVRWIISRFATADTPQWPAPDEEELRLADVRAEPSRLRARIADLRVEAATEADPPYRLRMLRLYPLETKVDDPRMAAPATRASGIVPDDAAEVAAESFAELGVVGLIVAGATSGGPAWATARGWASLDRDDVLRPEHRFPAYAVTKVVTATAVLRLVADGRVRLDERANAYLRTIRLADDAVTVRQLLAHTGGVDSPASMFADRVPDLVSVTGPVAACGGPHGTFAYGHGGYGMLGQLIADVTALAFPQAIARMVLDPLGMAGSSFPTSVPATGAATGHRLSGEGSFTDVPAQVFTLPAAGGLWTTAADLVSFGLGWSSLLPDTLSREALSPQAERDDFGGQAGPGWMPMLGKDVAGHPGAGSGLSASLIIRPRTGQPWVVLTNRQVLVEPINERLAPPDHLNDPTTRARGSIG